MTTLAIALRKITCVIEQESSDEPYVIVSAIDLSRKVTIPGQPSVIIPSVKTVRVGPFTNSVDTGQQVPIVPAAVCWGVDDSPEPVKSLDDFIILVAMMEHDDTNVNVVRSVVNLVITTSALANASAMPRAKLVKELATEMKGAIASANATQPFNSDELIGHVSELRLTDAQFKSLGANKKVKLDHALPFKKDEFGDDVTYKLTFAVRNFAF
jgi:hypothetical protein